MSPTERTLRTTPIVPRTTPIAVNLLGRDQRIHCLRSGKIFICQCRLLVRPVFSKKNAVSTSESLTEPDASAPVPGCRGSSVHNQDFMPPNGAA